MQLNLKSHHRHQVGKKISISTTKHFSNIYDLCHMCQKKSNISYNDYTVFRFYAGFTEYSFSTKVLIYIALPCNLTDYM